MTQSSLRKPDPKGAEEYFRNRVEFTTGPVELSQLLDDVGICIVDVRDEDDFAKGHIPGAVSLPQDRWSSMEGLDKSNTNVIYCYSQQCHLGANAALRFARAGYPVMELEGGFEAWRENELPVEMPGQQRKSPERESRPAM